MTTESDLLFAEAACGLALTDATGLILKVNRVFCDWLGCEASSLEGTAKFQSLLTVGGRIFHQTHWLPLMQLQGSVAEIKLDFRHRNGSKIPMLVNARALSLPDGQVRHTIAATVASDRDRYERELLKARADAEQLLRQRTLLQEQINERSLFAEQLVGIVSHDLRNPLTAIRMGTEMIALDDEDPRRLKLASRINRSVDRALSLVEDLLDFTLTKSGRSLSLRCTAFDLHDAVEVALDELRWAFPDVVIHHRREETGFVTADAERLVRVLGNLVANAARYGDNTAPITVTTTLKNNVARLEVHNSGPPIPSDQMPTIFQPMTRGDGHHGGGVGLGLYIVCQIALSHGGRPFATSDHAAGTRMGIEFPIQPATAADSPIQTGVEKVFTPKD